MVKRVLSIDGGGIRGLIPAVFCAQIERWRNVRIHELFDLIAGTSTGGIVAMGLASGKSATELVEFYKTKGPKIFNTGSKIGSLTRRFTHVLSGSKYKSKELRSAALEYFGDLKISKAMIDVLVPTYDIRHRRPLYVSRRRAKNDPNEDYLMQDVAVATSAAPTYFPPAQLGKEIVIDGGIVANNPACLAYAEARQLWPNDEILLVSLGTGTLNKPIPEKEAAKWGKISWVESLIDCVFDGTAQATEDYFRYTQLPNYWRFQSGLSERTAALDGVSESALLGLEQIGREIAKNREREILELVDERLRKVGAATLKRRPAAPLGR